MCVLGEGVPMLAASPALAARIAHTPAINPALTLTMPVLHVKAVLIGNDTTLRSMLKKKGVRKFLENFQIFGALPVERLSRNLVLASRNS